MNLPPASVRNIEIAAKLHDLATGFCGREALYKALLDESERTLIRKHCELGAEILDGRPDQRCFGAVDISVRRNAFGRQVDSFEADLEVEGLDEAFHALFIRAPWVEKVGQDVEVVARIASGEAMGRIVAVRQANLLATSFHPEITGDHRMHALFVEMVRSRPDGTPAKRK